MWHITTMLLMQFSRKALDLCAGLGGAHQKVALGSALEVAAHLHLLLVYEAFVSRLYWWTGIMATC